MRIQDVAGALFAAPEWLRIDEVTVETDDYRAILAPHELEEFDYPRQAFRISFTVRPTQQP